MSVTICPVAMLVLITRGPYIPLFIKVAPKVYTVDDLGKSKESNVELAHRGVIPMFSSDKKWICDILLDNPLFTKLFSFL